jgi:FdhD protein
MSVNPVSDSEGAGTPSRPLLSRAGREPTHSAEAVDEYGRPLEKSVAGEFPLTIYLNKSEVVTLMTMGTHPEALTLGYLKNQGLVANLADIESVQVDWETESASVVTVSDSDSWASKLGKRTVTTGCGQGTVFGDVMEQLAEVRLPPMRIRQSVIYSLLRNLSAHNEIYKSAGAVHGCALCQGDNIEMFVEDVGRHNAVDAIAGMMWLDDVSGADKLFYTTGRLTSEMVIKVAQMGIPILLSRSGITKMGLDLARQIGVLMISRAKGRHFLVYHGADRVEFDARPEHPGYISGGKGMQD